MPKQRKGAWLPWDYFTVAGALYLGGVLNLWVSLLDFCSVGPGSLLFWGGVIFWVSGVFAYGRHGVSVVQPDRPVLSSSPPCRSPPSSRHKPPHTCCPVARPSPPPAALAAHYDAPVPGCRRHRRAALPAAGRPGVRPTGPFIGPNGPGPTSGPG